MIIPRVTPKNNFTHNNKYNAFLNQLSKEQNGIQQTQLTKKQKRIIVTSAAIVPLAIAAFIKRKNISAFFSSLFNKTNIENNIQKTSYKDLSKEEKAIVDKIASQFDNPVYHAKGYEKEREADLLKLKDTIAKRLGLIK